MIIDHLTEHRYNIVCVENFIQLHDKIISETLQATRALSAKFCMVQHNTTNLTDPGKKSYF